jgi:hypothetical protein
VYNVYLHGVYDVKLSVEQIYLSSQIEATNMVVDTGSTYNLIGQQLLPILNERLQAGGHKLKLEDTLKYFKFGGHDNIECKKKTNIPLCLVDITKNIEVYIVPEKIPFLIGGQTLRSMEAEIKLAPNTLTVDGRRIQMDLTPSGHMTLPWNIRSHSTKQVNQVNLTQKVSRKEFNQPKVMTAMIKEITNLNNNGTYTEVKQEPWQTHSGHNVGNKQIYRRRRQERRENQGKTGGQRRPRCRRRRHSM